MQNESEPRKRLRSNPPKYQPGKDMEIALLIVVWSRGMDVAPKEQMSLKKISHWAIQIGDTIYEYGLDDHELHIVTVDEWHDGGKHTHGKRQL
ncbi:hypothetical protein SLS60_002673 [Paraconiothyrium brasiliense]|uniref:Uncharacterized protein n=1 Tax=Paraconiothyrium brasiliense TaxID=300254 RepID=A0ABR3RUV6_9PLEO